MPLNPEIILGVHQPETPSPLQSIAGLMQLRGQMSEIALRQAQQETARQNALNIQAETAQKQRDVADQNTIQSIEKDPDSYAKILSGDLSPLAGKVSEASLTKVRSNVDTALQNEALRSKEELDRRTAAAKTIGANLASAAQTFRGDDGKLDVSGFNSVLPSLIAEHAPELKALGVDPNTLPKSVEDEAHLNLLASRVNAFGSMLEAAQGLKAKQAETQKNLSASAKDQADAEQAKAQAAHLAATLPEDQAKAQIAKLNADFAATHNGLTPEHFETQRHNQAAEKTAAGELAVKRAEGGIKEKQFEATFGSGLDANGQPLAPDALKAAALQDPTAVAIAHYQVAPPPAQTRGGLPSPVMRKVLAINPQYDATTYPARAETARGFSPSGAQGQAITAADTALAHLNTLSQAGEALKNGDIQVLNKVANAVGAQVGATPKATYDTILNMVGPEISKAVIGAVGGEGERAATAGNFTSSLSSKQREANIAAAVGLLGARFDKASHAYEQQMGVPLPRQLSPESQAIRQKYSGSSTASLPKGNGAVIDKATARKFYDAAGGDPAKAQKLAEDNGWKVQ